MERHRVQLLKQVPIFKVMDERSLEALASRCRLQKFRPQQTLFFEGDLGYTLYIILKGSVNIQSGMASGKTVHIATREVGEVFGELSLFDGKPRMADAIAAEACETLVLERSEFIRCIQETPEVALQIMAYLAERLREAAEQLESQQELDVLGRVSELLLELSATHGKPHSSGGTQITTKITQQEIAERVGSARETVSRTLARLKSVKAIALEGRNIIVLSPEGLEKRCQR